MYQKCKKCGLPGWYLGIHLDENGECNYCKSSTEDYHYLGFEALQNDINRVLKDADHNRKYECAVGLSGGRDSSYLLYFAKKVLGLRVLAITMNHDFLSTAARKNITTFVDKMDVDIHFIENNVLSQSSRKCVQSWGKKPDVAMCATFCTGCRYGLDKLLPEYVKNLNIPLLLRGNTPLEEQVDFHVDLFCDNKKTNTFNKAIGFAKRLIKNPRYLRSPITLYYQFMDFVHFNRNWSRPLIIQPFFDYLEWKEEEVLSMIKQLGWEQDNVFTSSWRSDCYVGLIRQYFYKVGLGYNDIDVYYANLLRHNKIKKEDAILLRQKAGDIDEANVKSILKEYYNVDYDDVMCRMPVYRKDEN